MADSIIAPGSIVAGGTIRRSVLFNNARVASAGRITECIILPGCDIGAGARLLIPVDTPGGLFSAGDAHFAQGDGEICGTAIEMRATLRVRFGLHKREAADKNIRDLRFTREDYYLPPEYAAPRRFYATTGISVTKEGVNHSEDVTLAARNALLNMIDHLTERGWTRQQAYAICSVAVDLKISQVVDAPNMLVSAFLPEAIFTG